MPAQAWVTLIVGSVAAIGVIITWQQKNRADRRAEWWRRAQWAFERTFSDDDRQTAFGLAMLEALMTSRLVTKDEAALVRLIGLRIALGGGEEEADNGG